jgi:hypothetical protein
LDNHFLATVDPSIALFRFFLSERGRAPLIIVVGVSVAGALAAHLGGPRS